jgi:hypothetical protein
MPARDRRAFRSDALPELCNLGLGPSMETIIFVPYKYEMEQIETIAREIIPRLKAK